MPADLQSIVQRMVEAGESEDNIATVIRHYKSSAPTQQSGAGGYFGIPDVVGDVVKGAAKGVGNTFLTLGQAAGSIPNIFNPAGGNLRQAVDAMYGQPKLSESAFAAAREGITPRNTAENVGYGLEQAAEFLLPAGAAEKGAAAITAKLAPRFHNSPRLVRVAPRMVTDAASAAGVSTAQGHDPTVGAVAGAVSPVVAEAGGALAPYLRAKAEASIRAAVKPTVSSLRKIAGAGATGLDAQAKKLARFLLDNKVTTADQARAIVADADQQLKGLVAAHPTPTDAPQRAARYLDALERSAAKQGLAGDDVAAIRNASAEMLEGVMGKDVVTMVPAPHPTLVQPNGQPIIVMVPQKTRALRSDVMADEALESARASSQWSTRKQWGEQKGATMESAKAVERGQRDAVKAAVPGAARLLNRQQQALAATEALDRMALRTANRDTLSLPGIAAGGAEIAAGKVPIVGLAAQWLRNNQMKAGVWANRMAEAIARQDVQEIASILNRFGVGATSQVAR